MARDRHDDRTADLLGWEPPPLTPPVARADVSAKTPRDRMAQIVASVLRDSELSRAEITSRMSEFLREPVSLPSLNQAASQAREDHTIAAIRLAALAHATGDVRPLAVLIEGLGYTLVPNDLVPLIHAERRVNVARQLEAEARRQRKQAERERRLQRTGT